MKRVLAIIALLALVAAFTFTCNAQGVRSYTAILGVNFTVHTDTVVIKQGSKILTVNTKTLADLPVGTHLYGVGIVPGTTVAVATVDSLSLTMSLPAYASSSGASKFYANIDTVHAAYQDGDVMGEPFLIENLPPGAVGLAAVVLEDNLTNAKDFDIVFMSSAPAAYIADNATFAPTDADARLIVGIVNVTTHKTYSANSISTWSTGVGIPLEGSSKLWGFLVARSTQTFASNLPLKLKLLFAY